MKAHWKAFAAAFLLGAVVGVLAGAKFERIAEHRFWQHGPNADRIVKRLTKELTLDESQQTDLRKIIGRFDTDTMKLQKDTQERFDKIRMASRAEIAKILKPEQSDKFKAMTARWDARRAKTQVEIHR